MQLKATSSILFLLLLFSCAQVKNSQQQRIVPNAIPVLHITNDTTATAIKISSLAIDVKVAANTAITTFDIVFYNPNNRILEGEFEFPLADGQHIVRYALDIEGKLREGVVVEKAKARVAYESTVRRVIDPGLVEKTKGNNFRTRIYPLPAKGTRHILIAVEQTLEQLNKELFYQLPLHTLQPIDNFSVKAAVIKSTERPATQKNNLTNFQFDKWENGWMASYSKKNFSSTQSIAFAIPYSAANETTILTENYNSQTFFYVNNRMEPAYQQKKAPGTVGILWDISASGEKRNIEKEKKLLEEYLSGDVQVILIPFHVYAQEKETFTINNGDCKALLKRIDQLRYDGGTQLGAIDLTKYQFDEVLLFSDGLSNFGKKEMMPVAVPVMAISSSSSADYSSLKFIAQESNGKFIDLTKMEIPAAAEAIKNLSLQVIKIEFNPAEMEEVVAQVSPIQSSGLSIAGKLKVSAAELKVLLGYGTEVVATKTFTITRPNSSEYDQVKRIWATMKIDELDLQFEKNKVAITKLGKDFSIVTQNTSLLVLDRVEDYVEHEITPPAELLKEYTALLATKLEEKRNEKESAMDNAVYVMNDLKEWWNRNYSPAKPKKPEPVITEENLEAAAVVDSAVTSGSPFLHLNAPVIEADKMVGTDSGRAIAGMINPGVGAYSYQVSDSTQNYFANGNALTQSFSATQDTDGDGVLLSLENEAKKDEVSNTISTTSIELSEWKPEAPYLKDLEKVSASERIATYFELRKIYAAQPSFFIDVARFFFAKKERLFGLQVLSNVAEMKLEDAELIRNLANQLLEANEKELAVETFQDVVKMREEDPQSYRDLALALSETEQYNEAVQLLYKVITESWDGRFGEIKAIALNEMNAIISAHKGEVNIAGIDSRLIFAMPVDVRIVIGWSSDNSDIDLWVTDPREEKCDYSHNETVIGGKMSDDVTQGFGPEEFILKKAANGKYKIEVNLYGDSRQTLGGPIAIKADLYTNYGKPSQKKETINFRVTEGKEVVQIGALRFGS